MNRVSARSVASPALLSAGFALAMACVCSTPTWVERRSTTPNTAPIATVSVGTGSPSGGSRQTVLRHPGSRGAPSPPAMCQEDLAGDLWYLLYGYDCVPPGAVVVDIDLGPRPASGILSWLGTDDKCVSAAERGGHCHVALGNVTLWAYRGAVQVVWFSDVQQMSPTHLRTFWRER